MSSRQAEDWKQLDHTALLDGNSKAHALDSLSDAEWDKECAQRVGQSDE